MLPSRQTPLCVRWWQKSRAMLTAMFCKSLTRDTHTRCSHKSPARAFSVGVCVCVRECVCVCAHDIECSHTCTIMTYSVWLHMCLTGWHLVFLSSFRIILSLCCAPLPSLSPPSCVSLSVPPGEADAKQTVAHDYSGANVSVRMRKLTTTKTRTPRKRDGELPPFSLILVYRTFHVFLWATATPWWNSS